MFNLFKKKTQEDDGIVAAVDGELNDLSTVSDPVFSQRMMGEGIAIVPSGNIIVAPISGKIISLPSSKHAIGIKNSSGLEVLVHIGLDTVNLNGEGFTSMVKEGQEVKQGQKLVTVDSQTLRNKGYNLTVMTIFTSNLDRKVRITSPRQVHAGDKILEN